MNAGGKGIDPAGENDLSRQVEVGLEAPLVAHLEDVSGVLCTEGASRGMAEGHPLKMQLHK